MSWFKAYKDLTNGETIVWLNNYEKKKNCKTSVESTLEYARKSDAKVTNKVQLPLSGFQKHNKQGT